MPADVLEVTKRFMRDPVRILVKKEELTLEGIRQFYIEVEQEVIINAACPFLQIAAAMTINIMASFLLKFLECL